jgi:hypothetical protein
MEGKAGSWKGQGWIMFLFQFWIFCSLWIFWFHFELLEYCVTYLSIEFLGHALKICIQGQYFYFLPVVTTPRRRTENTVSIIEGETETLTGKTCGLSVFITVWLRTGENRTQLQVPSNPGSHLNSWFVIKDSWFWGAPSSWPLFLRSTGIFKVASVYDLLEPALCGKSGWDTSGTYPATEAPKVMSFLVCPFPVSPSGSR